MPVPNWLRIALATAFLLAAGAVVALALWQAQLARQKGAPLAVADRGAPWSSTCTSAGRNEPVGCMIEQRVVLRGNGALLTAVRLNFPPDNQPPNIVIQTPFGLALKSGIALQLDNDQPTNFDVQTCDQGGCYAGSVVTDEMLTRLSKASKLTVHFVGSAPVDVPVSMNGFAAALRSAR
jgi:invasion protein IalB